MSHFNARVCRYGLFARPAVIAMVLAAGHATAIGAVLILPGVNPDGGLTSAHAINNSGLVVGDTIPSNPGPPRVAALWTGGVRSTLPGIVGAPTGGFQGEGGLGINNSGVVVGIAAYPIPGPGGNLFAGHAVRWTNGVAADLGVLPGHTVGVARAINDSGQIAGNCFGGPASTAVRWNALDEIQPLGLLPTHSSSLASDINASGRVVGWSGIPDGDLLSAQQPVYWDDLSATPITLPAGYNFGLANGINDAGRIVGTAVTFNPETFTFDDVRAASWIADVATLLPLLPDTIASSASKVNAGGWVIGACYDSADGAYYEFGGVPVLWTEAGAMDLTPLLAPSFPAGSTYVLSDINDSGEISGTASLGEEPFGSRAFVLTVPSAGVPAMAMIGLGLTARRRRR